MRNSSQQRAVAAISQGGPQASGCSRLDRRSGPQTRQPSSTPSSSNSGNQNPNQKSNSHQMNQVNHQPVQISLIDGGQQSTQLLVVEDPSSVSKAISSSQYAHSQLLVAEEHPHQQAIHSQHQHPATLAMNSEHRQHEPQHQHQVPLLHQLQPSPQLLTLGEPGAIQSQAHHQQQHLNLHLNHLNQQQHLASRSANNSSSIASNHAPASQSGEPMQNDNNNSLLEQQPPTNGGLGGGGGALQSQRNQAKQVQLGKYEPTQPDLGSAVIAGWLFENYEVAEGQSLPRSTVYNHYLASWARKGWASVNAASFGKVIRSVFLGLKTRRLGTRGHSKYHYFGVRAKPHVQHELLQLQANCSSEGSPLSHHQSTCGCGCRRACRKGGPAHHSSMHKSTTGSSDGGPGSESDCSQQGTPDGGRIKRARRCDNETPDDYNSSEGASNMEMPGSSENNNNHQLAYVQEQELISHTHNQHHQQQDQFIETGAQLHEHHLDQQVNPVECPLHGGQENHHATPVGLTDHLHQSAGAVVYGHQSDHSSYHHHHLHQNHSASSLSHCHHPNNHQFDQHHQHGPSNFTDINHDQFNHHHHQLTPLHEAPSSSASVQHYVMSSNPDLNHHQHYEQQPQHHQHHHQLNDQPSFQAEDSSTEYLRSFLGANWATLVDEHWPTAPFDQFAASTNILLSADKPSTASPASQLKSTWNLFETRYKQHYRLMVELLSELKFDEIEQLWRHFWNPPIINDNAPNQAKSSESWPDFESAQHSQAATPATSSSDAEPKLDNNRNSGHGSKDESTTNSQQVVSNETNNNNQNLNGSPTRLTYEILYELTSHAMIGHHIAQIDNCLYEALQAFLIPDLFREVPRQLVQLIRYLAKAYRSWTEVWLKNYELSFQEHKLRVARIFGHSLARSAEIIFLSLNTRQIWNNPSLLAEISLDLSRVDLIEIEQQVSLMNIQPQLTYELAQSQHHHPQNHQDPHVAHVHAEHHQLSQTNHHHPLLQLTNNTSDYPHHNQNPEQQHQLVYQNYESSVSSEGAIHRPHSNEDNANSNSNPNPNHQSSSSRTTTNSHQLINNNNTNNSQDHSNNDNNHANHNNGAHSIRSQNPISASSTSQLILANSMNPAQLIQNFLHLLEGPMPGENWPDWCKNLVESRVSPGSLVESRNFLLNWNYYMDLICKDLTFRRVRSCAAFQLIKMLFDAYILSLIDSLRRTATNQIQQGTSNVGSINNRPPTEPIVNIISTNVNSNNQPIL